MKPFPRCKLYYRVWILARWRWLTQVSLLQTNGTQAMTLCKLPEGEAVLFNEIHTRIMPFLNLHWPNGRGYPTQVKRRAFKMKVTQIMSSYITM